MGRKARSGFTVGLVACLTMAMGALSGASAAALKIGYSDWPGWVSWQVAIDKGWFKEEGVEVEFEWFDYVPSMDAFSAGKIDGVGMTNGDALVVGATGAKSVIILINDYSNGNDMVIAKPGITSIPELKGKKVGLEVGFVSHLMLLNALEKAGLTEADVTLVNTKTNETPQVLASGDVDAVTTWQPSSSQALKLVPGSTAIYTSADEPGLIYDVLAVNPASLSSRRAEWLKVLKVWDRVVAYINDPKTADDALKILAGRVGLKPEEYKPFLGGTRLLTLAESKKVYEKADGFKSIYGSTQIVDNFNIKYEVYKEKQDIGSYLDPSLTNELAP